MKHQPRFLLTLVVGLSLLFGLVAVAGGVGRPVHAATTLTVTNCSTDTQLQADVSTANSDNAGDTITFACSGDIPLTSTLTISGSMTLNGSGQQVTLDGQHQRQVLLVNGGVTLTLKALTIANGSAPAGIDNTGGGTVRITNSTIFGNGGDGIDNTSGTLSITTSTVSGNSGSGINNNGGTVRITTSTVSSNAAEGIFSFGTLSITNSTVSGNTGGDGIFSSGIASITNSTVSGNAGEGFDNSTQIGDSRDGIHNFNSTMRITTSTVCGNASFGVSTMCITNSTISGNAGGGIGNFDGTMRITTSTVSGNTGGGIFNDSGTLGTTLSIITSTVSGNAGSGIFNNGGPLRITTSTVSGNTGGGIFNTSGGRMRIGGSIVATNTESNCAGILTDQGYNLSNDSSCHFTASTSLQNTDPKLDPAGLANNGGPTQTIALEPDSPAVDHIQVGSSCPASGTTDQRGVARPQGPACDIGAFEMTAADGLTVMIHVVNSFHLAKGLQTSLDSQLHAVLADLQANNTAKACSDLTSFIYHVKAQSGKGLTTAQATQLLKEAAVIHTRLGC